MEADDCQPAARAQHGERGGQRLLERGELVVDGDSESLEDALRRVSVSEATRGGNRSLDRLDELGGALDGPLAPAPDDRARDLAGESLLTVTAEDRRGLPLLRLVD